MEAEGVDQAEVGGQGVGVAVREAAADHDQVGGFGEALAPQGGEFDEVGAEGFQGFQRVGEIAAERLVLGIGDPEPRLAGEAPCHRFGRERSAVGQRLEGREVDEPTETLGQWSDQVFGKGAAPGRLGQGPADLGQCFDGADHGLLQEQPDGGGDPIEVFGIFQAVDQDGVDPPGEFGQVHALPPGAIQKGHDGQVEGLGDRSEAAGAVVVLAAQGRGRFFERPLDHREVGTGRALGEDLPADVGGHQPGVEVTTGQARGLIDRLGGGRAGPGSEMLHTPTHRR